MCLIIFYLLVFFVCVVGENFGRKERGGGKEGEYCGVLFFSR